MPEQTISATWYRTDRFMQKAEEEIYRGVRYQASFSVVTCSVSPFDAGAADAVSDFVHDHLRQVDFVTRLSLGRYAFGLPFTSTAGAGALAETLRDVMGRYNPVVGVACAPEDGSRAQAIMATAELNALPTAPTAPRELQRAG